MPAKKNTAGQKNAPRKVVVVQTPSKSARRRRNKRSMAQITASPFIPGKIRFDAESNGLKQKMAGLQLGVSQGGMPSQGAGTLLGSTGNWYLDTVVDPYRAPVPYPDEYDRPSGVHQSFAYLNLTGDAANAVPLYSGGNGFLIFNPIWGDGATAGYRNRWMTYALPNSFVGGVTTFTFADDPDLAIFTQGASPLAVSDRPVSGAMYISFIGDTLADGGQVSCAWLPGDTSAATITALIAGGIASVCQVQGAYTGPLSKGAYIFWKPDAVADHEFRLPTAVVGSDTTQIGYSFPLLVMAFSSTHAATLTMRAACVLNHEFTSNRRVVPMNASPVQPELIDHAAKVLRNFPQAVANDDHVSLWDRIRTGAVQFFQMIGDSVKALFAPSTMAASQAVQGVLNSPGLPAAAALAGAVLHPY